MAKAYAASPDKPDETMIGDGLFQGRAANRLADYAGLSHGAVGTSLADIAMLYGNAAGNIMGAFNSVTINQPCDALRFWAEPQS
jgi:hypothetical protein